MFACLKKYIINHRCSESKILIIIALADTMEHC